MIEYANFNKQCKWGEQKTSTNSNKFQLGQLTKVIEDPSKGHYPPCYIFKAKSIILNEHLVPEIKARLFQICNIPQFDHLTRARAAIIMQPKSLIYTISNYFNGSTSLLKLIGIYQFSAFQIHRIFYQVACALEHLEKQSLNHLRLTPSSVLVKLPDQFKGISAPMILLDDIGMGPEEKSSEIYCRHPNFNGDWVGKSFAELIKFDLWSFGVLIFYCFMLQIPFTSKISFFNQSKKFDVKETEEPEKWINKMKGRISPDSFILSILKSCWDEKSHYQSWKQVKAKFEQNIFIANVERIPIYQIYVKHVRLLFLFSNMYVLIRRSIKMSERELWRDEDLLEKISECLVKLMSNYHNQQFCKIFGNRCSILPFEQLEILKKISQFLNSQLAYLQSSQIVNSSKTIEDILNIMNKTLIKFEMKIKQIKENQREKSLKIVLSFFEEFLKCCRQSTKIIKSIEKGEKDVSREDFIVVMYDSKVFQSISVKDFHFSLLPSIY